LELVNPKASGETNAMVSVIVPADGQNMYIVLRGPAEIVARHKADFETFARSVRFE
jgi:hypothetical protein